MGRGAKLKRYYDIMHPPKEDKRAPQDIVKDIATRAGIKVVKSHERNGPDGDIGT